MKHLFTLALFFVSSMAFAMDEQILGAWKTEAPIVQNGPLQVFLGMNMKPDNTADMSAICIANGQTSEASVTVAVSVENGMINVLENKSAQVTGCQVQMTTGSVAYRVENGRLILTAEGAPSLAFIRR